MTFFFSTRETTHIKQMKRKYVEKHIVFTYFSVPKNRLYKCVPQEFKFRFASGTFLN